MMYRLDKKIDDGSPTSGIIMSSAAATSCIYEINTTIAPPTVYVGLGTYNTACGALVGLMYVAVPL
jgi:hypothetical protein